MDKQNGKKRYVKIRLRLSAEKLRAAKLLLQNNELRDSVSRAYYCAFYAAKAFLLKHGEDPSSHHGVDVTFHHFCATHKKPSPELARLLSLMRQARLDADYKELAQITKEDAQEAISMAQSFLKEIRSLLK